MTPESEAPSLPGRTGPTAPPCVLLPHLHGRPGGALCRATMQPLVSDSWEPL
ncbi:MAG: hypothetical protein JWO98_300 [Frankiales bacterium]|nr:hypothetical protein [Frankiales bacterium]